MILFVLLWLSSQQPQPAGCERHVAGVVSDEAGQGVAGASVVLSADDRTTRDAVTDRSGAFEITGLSPGAALILARANGTESERPVVVPACGAVNVQIVLAAPRFSEQITVSASPESRELSIPASTSIVSNADLLLAAPPVLDDVLRSVPTFSLFRRSSSRTANPTTQGVSLRGLGASGASRAVVLADGVSFNDPFGGWVYWDRVPTLAIDRVEVVRGGMSDRVGADAVGGLVNIVTRAPRDRELQIALDGGSGDTRRGSAFGAATWRGFGVVGAAEVSRTSGFLIVPTGFRGAIDTRAGSDYQALWMSAGRRARGDGVSVRMWGNLFSEDRANGTPDQRNNTRLGAGTAEAEGPAAGGTWLVRGSAETQHYEQTFSAIATDRSSERLIRSQVVPAHASALTATWTRQSTRYGAMVGADVHWVAGTTDETAFVPGRADASSSAGGTTNSGAVFARASVPLGSRLVADVGVRADTFRLEPRDGERRQFGAFSPRMALVWQAHPNIAARVAFYQAFRAPTLNELYRDFRVGNITTDANALLGPERFTGVETAASFTLRWTAIRIVAHRGRLHDAITNVTLRQDAAGIVRRRQNAGTIDASGVEVEATSMAWHGLALDLAGSVGDSRFGQDSGALQDHLVPLVSRFQVAAGVRYLRGRWLAGASLRIASGQYEDDLNELPLSRAVVANVSVSRDLGRGVSVFAAIENVFNDEYDVGRTPVRTVGLPRTARIALRAGWKGGGR